MYIGIVLGKNNEKKGNQKWGEIVNEGNGKKKKHTISKSGGLISGSFSS